MRNNLSSIEPCPAGWNQTIHMPQHKPLFGDLLFIIMHRSELNNDKIICRFGINTAFMNRKENGMKLTCNFD